MEDKVRRLVAFTWYEERKEKRKKEGKKSHETANITEIAQTTLVALAE